MQCFKFITATFNFSLYAFNYIGHSIVTFSSKERKEKVALTTSAGGVLIQVIIYVVFILVMLGIIQYFFDPLGQLSSAKDTQRIKDLQTIKTALNAYYAYYGRYPASDNQYRIMDLSNNSVNWGEQWQVYLPAVPKDPDADRSYAYIASPDKQAYYLYASLENPKENTHACSGKCSNAPIDACGDNLECNYGVTSSNVAP